jgi:hypothetical protein
LVLNKVLAGYVGSAGYATIGQFQNVVSILLVWSVACWHQVSPRARCSILTMMPNSTTSTAIVSE